MNKAQFFLPPTNVNASIGLLGGTFDPPHLGHMMLALSFLALEDIDELWVIPCSDHAHKENMSPFDDRLAMCKLAFTHLQKVKVLDIEHHLSRPNYTINTIDTILTHRPDLNLKLAIGSDLILSFSSWHQAQMLSERASIVIFEREQFPITSLPKELQKAKIHKAIKLPNINSTRLRQISRLQSPQDDSFIDLNVRRYMREHALYQ